MIVSVTSKDGFVLYTKVLANTRVAFELTQSQLRAVAAQRTAAELVADEYYYSPVCAAALVPCPGCSARAAA